MRIAVSLFLFCVSISCQPDSNAPAVNPFEKDLLALKEYFRIPGLAAIVKKDGEIVYENYLGFADLENIIPLDSNNIVCRSNAAY